MKKLNIDDYLNGTKLADTKYKELIENIKEEKNTEDKLDGVATLVFMLINNDISCLEARQIRIERKIDKLSKRFLIGSCIILGTFIALNPGSLETILKIIKLII